MSIESKVRTLTGTTAVSMRSASPGRHTGILVLGMHRSGTSAITRVLNLLGVDLGQDLMPGESGVNDKGFWEHLEVVRINERLLQWHGASWFTVQPFERAALEDGAGEQAVVDMRAFLRAEFGGSALWAIKDPRLSLFVPLWMRAMREEDVEVRCILAVRHPDEVAASLQKRDGLTRGHGHLLWGRYLADAVKASTGQVRAVCDYAALLADWRGEMQRLSRELSMEWPILPEAAQSRIAEFLSEDQRHHHAPTASPSDDPLAIAVHGMYGRLLELAAGSADWSPIEQSVAEFERVSATLAPHMHELLQHVWIHADRARRAEERLALAGRHASMATSGSADSAPVNRQTIVEKEAGLVVAEQIQQQEAALAELRAHADGLVDVRRELEQRLQAAERQLDLQLAEVAGLRSVVSEKEARLVTAGQIQQQQESALAELRAHADGLADVRRELEQRLEATERQLDVQRAETDGLHATVALLHSVAAEKEARLAVVERNFGERDAYLASLRELAAQQSARLHAADEQQRHLESRLAELKVHSENLETSRTGLEARVRDLEGALADSVRQHHEARLRIAELEAARARLSAMELRAKVLDDELSRMKASRSWRYTSLFRGSSH